MLRVVQPATRRGERDAESHHGAGAGRIAPISMRSSPRDIPPPPHSSAPSLSPRWLLCCSWPRPGAGTALLSPERSPACDLRAADARRVWGRARRGAGTMSPLLLIETVGLGEGVAASGLLAGGCTHPGAFPVTARSRVGLRDDPCVGHFARILLKCRCAFFFTLPFPYTGRRRPRTNLSP